MTTISDFKGPFCQLEAIAVVFRRIYSQASLSGGGECSSLLDVVFLAEKLTLFIGNKLAAKEWLYRDLLY